jgi:prevent-host-death family protein
MESVLAKCSASISELKKNPSALIEQSDGEPIAILNHNRPTAYLIPAKTYEAILEKIKISEYLSHHKDYIQTKKMLRKNRRYGYNT